MFSPDQIAALSAPLNRAHVATRSQSGRNLSYIEGWHAIAEANRIFGFGNWHRETVELRQVAEHQRKVGSGEGWGVSYIARVRITVFAGEHSGIIREGIGTGHGIDRDLGLAHESAAKEAETDAMKRALMTFGNPFGLALYDKTQANVEAAPRVVPNNTNPAENEPGGASDVSAKWAVWAKGEIDKIRLANFDREGLAAWDKDNRKYFAPLKKSAPKEHDDLMGLIETMNETFDRFHPVNAG